MQGLVPGSSQKMLDKTRTLTVDNVTYDLEDSVTPSRKDEARGMLRKFLSQPRAPNIKEQAVRINAVETGLALHDLNEVLQSPNLDAIVVPKVQGASDLHFVTDVIRHTLPERHSATASFGRGPEGNQKPPLKIIALIESARAITELNSICNASPLLSGLIFAAEDFALDLSLRRTPGLTEFLYARSAIVTAARSFELPSTIDLVCTQFRGDEGKRILEEECAGGKGLGFNGKQCIHPDQVDIVQKTFQPSEKEVIWAVRVCIADEKASQQGRGAWTLDGKMIDAPVSGLARDIYAKAEACGIDVHAIKEQWKDQEPE
jgi:citrate lyase subunit beta-like protein